MPDNGYNDSGCAPPGYAGYRGLTFEPERSLAEGAPHRTNCPTSLDVVCALETPSVGNSAHVHPIHRALGLVLLAMKQ